MTMTKTLHHFKQRILLFCLFQGLISIAVILYTITYLPEVLAIEKPEPEVQIQQGQKFNKTKMADITWSFTSADGEMFVLFRFDKFFNGLEYDNWMNMSTTNSKYAYFRPGYRRDEIPDWFNVDDVFCGGCLKIHGKRIGYLYNATINPDLASGNVGGEVLTNIMNQSLETEYLKLKKGFIEATSVHILDIPDSYNLNIELQTFMNALKVIPPDIVSDTRIIRGKFAVLVTRFEYANFYHSTMNWYDIFLIMVVYNIKPKDLEVYWVDAHPKSSLDDIWEKLYGKCRRVKAIRNSITYRHMVWDGMGPRSPVNAHKLEDLPFVNEYRHFVLTKYRIPLQHMINCEQLRVTIIWRRPYIAHPRNPDGFVARRIYNEDEFWEAVSEALPAAVVNGVQLDKLTMTEQLELITTTDILIGMHGAGLSHILYLPKTSGVIEFFTQRTSVGNAHFRSMSKWRRIPYIVWINSNVNHEMVDHQTRIPIKALKDMVLKMEESLCKNGRNADMDIQDTENI